MDDKPRICLMVFIVLSNMCWLNTVELSSAKYITYATNEIFCDNSQLWRRRHAHNYRQSVLLFCICALAARIWTRFFLLASAISALSNAEINEDMNELYDISKLKSILNFHLCKWGRVLNLEPTNFGLWLRCSTWIKLKIMSFV